MYLMFGYMLQNELFGYLVELTCKLIYLQKYKRSFGTDTQLRFSLHFTTLGIGFVYLLVKQLRFQFCKRSI